MLLLKLSEKKKVPPIFLKRGTLSHDEAEFISRTTRSNSIW